MTLTFFGLIDAVRHHVSQLDSCITCTINFKEKKKKAMPEKIGRQGRWCEWVSQTHSPF